LVFGRRYHQHSFGARVAQESQDFDADRAMAVRAKKGKGKGREETIPDRPSTGLLGDCMPWDVNDEDTLHEVWPSPIP